MVRGATSEVASRGQIKCVVWDLDNTIWDGVLLEPEPVRLRTEIVERIRDLDRLGILQSIASKNDRDAAMTQLAEFGIADYFLYPEISWHPKSESVREIAKSLNIGTDTVAFVDDQPFELAEVTHTLPEVTTVDIAELDDALRRPEFQPRFVTDESHRRRQMYHDSITRDTAEREFTGTTMDFLATLDMDLTIRPAGLEDLRRAEELTIRTNQLNSTGVTYSYQELDDLRKSPDHLLLVASLRDRFGEYGTIGLCLVAKGDEHWTLLLLLMSCRVMSRGVGTVLLNHIVSEAQAAGRGLRAEFVETGRNRIMYVTYMFAGFREVSRVDSRLVLEAGPDSSQPPPDYLRLHVLDQQSPDSGEPGM